MNGNYKENLNMGQNASQTVKMEPSEYKIPPLNPSNGVKVKGDATSATTPLKPDADASKSAMNADPNASNSATDSDSDPSKDATPVPNQDADAKVEEPAPPPRVPSTATDYKVYGSPAEIEYTPEHALQEGLKMVNKMASSIQALQLGPRRKEVWQRDTTSLRGQGAPSTLIAVCGATGAGKSSILNAILDDNIVPTSGMRACTAVVTEIAYHKKKTIDADVSFLTKNEWKAELNILLGDLVEEDGTLKRSTDLTSDAGVAYSKVHAVYPTVSREKLVSMTADQIIAKDPKIERILGQTKRISARDSKVFAIEIAKYIDSKDQRRGKDKKDKGKKKDKNKDANTPALWPLIRQVNVRCSSAALSTDTSNLFTIGTGDANAARNSIAKNYMKKANSIWVLAPIMRAVDSKIAKDLLGDAFRNQLMMDGGYDDNTITFIATKCDDISCSEIITSLRLHDEPELEVIQDKIEAIADETTETKKKKTTADRLVKSMEAELKRNRAIHVEHKEHLECFEDGKPFVPRLTAKKTEKTVKAMAPKGKKRKNSRGGKRGSPKRRRSDSLDHEEDQDDKMEESDGEESDLFKSDSDNSDIDSDSDDEDSESDKDSDEEDDEEDDELDSDRQKSSDSESDNEKDSDIESVHDMEEEVTEESIKHDIAESKKLMDETLQRLNEARKQKKEASDRLATLKKKATTAQKEKNAFCSMKRSEFSREVLKEDFRTGLKDLDEAAAEERDPANFDPSVPIRDYSLIDLPVFTVSSRDYVRIKKQVKDDGEPTCFSNVRDTGIPGTYLVVPGWTLTVTHPLQMCKSGATTSPNPHASVLPKILLKHLGAFANDVKQYVAGIGEVTAGDRESLREKWESGEQDVPNSEGDPYEDDPFAAILGGSGNLYTMPQSVPKRDRYGQLIGITPRLAAEFGNIVETSVTSLKDHLHDGLEERCRVGAASAADAAVSTSDEFASSMHWASYRATLRRNGEYRRDLNVELTFEADIFSPLLKSIVACIDKLVGDVERSAAPGLKDRTKLQGESCLDSARTALDKTIETVKETLTSQQKEISRCLAPHVQAELLDGYERAMEEHGKGSVARQRASFHSYIVDCKEEMFEQGANVIIERLDGAADAVGETLKAALDNLAQKIEVNLAVLWEGVRDDPTQVKARSEVVTEVNRVLQQLQFFSAAEKARHIPDEDTVMD
ncbi:Nuclear GTPase SLIP-GC [Mycena venus]|uniref:Nuclear GTPase SLIP-GC n=1 Tax=Mycena venus TaxID=2733690 RepID=A0A8H7CWA4_9AGAR|nr:Nuclear GTPase SLIP-GC [Mycena venus]